MSSTTVLPPELIDETIDHLWDDPKSLRACSLTCKSWLPASRLHLFRTVRLSSLEDCERFSALLDSAPVIGRCVRSLAITADYSGVDTQEQSLDKDSWVNSAAELAKLLPRVHTLALSRMRWSTLQAEKREAFKGMCRSVRKLFLYELRFHSSGDVLDFLNTFPELDQLYFHAVSWNHESATVPSTSATDLVHAAAAHRDASPTQNADKMHLTYLFLDPRSSPTLVTEWILSHPSDQRLRTIQLCWREMDSTKALGDLLRASGSSLEHLQIEFPEGVPEEAVLHNHLSLASNTALRSLSFGGLDVSASNVFLSAHLFPWVSHMLSDLHSPHLREVTFELETRTMDGLGCLDWARIDAELSRREFTGLTVRFYVNCEKADRGSEEEKAVKKQIEEYLPGFVQRGLLRVSCI